MKLICGQLVNNFVRFYVIIVCCWTVIAFETNQMDDTHDSSCDDNIHDHKCTDEIVVRLSKRDTWLADRIAEKHGYKNLGAVGSLPGYFWFKRKDGTRKKRQIFDPLMEDSDVRWAEPQFSKKRVKRDYIFHDHKKRQANNSSSSSPNLPWPDPLYSKQWYLTAGAVGGYDMKVKEAWTLGYSGKGVVVSILDDGLQKAHPDLAENYDPEASTDINDNDQDPTPKDDDNNKHGTRCAGEVSAVAGNNICGVGIAYHSKIGGVRMLDGTISDRVEGAALSLKQNHIDIYSASWGPDDDGRTVDGPGVLAKDAFYYGATKGRHGKGNIFIWASGNGGTHQDSCSCDGYAISIFTLSVSSATYDNRQPWYSEECPSTLATTYSSGFSGQPAVITTDMPDTCTEYHTGTSASAPIAAGIVALALEANPNLTWRDVQHLVIRTSNAQPLLQNPGWSKNGAGRMISNKFGYGLMDAEALVKAALVWKTVPPQHSYTYSDKHNEPKELTGKFSVNFTINVDNVPGRELRYLEHVQSVISVKVYRRGDLQMTLYSPAGTKSILLPPRSSDNSSLGFSKWPFMSVQQWGENPRGIWILNVENVGTELNSGIFQEWSLTLFGTDLPIQPNEDDAKKTSIVHENCHSECNSEGCYATQSAHGCVSCKYYKQFSSNSSESTCVTQCDKKFYVDQVGKRCHPCLDECSTCSDTNYCRSCPRDTYLIDENNDETFRGRCIEKCPDGYVKDESDEMGGRCLHVCDSKNCLTCDGQSKCRYCKENFFMTSTGECVQKCFDGWYSNGTDRQCHRCMENCETCLNSHSCNVCSTGFFWNSTISRCSTPALTSCRKDADCQHGSFCELSGQKCQLCHPDCETCFGPEFDLCLKCKNGLPVDRLTRQCSICHRGQYYDSKSGECNPCANSCESCIGPGVSQCLDCNVGFKQVGLSCKPCCHTDGNQQLSCVLCKSDEEPSTSLVAKLVIGFVVGGILCIVALAITVILMRRTCQNVLGNSKYSVRYFNGK